MAEDERAAKAARAKAMLKKRQQQKKAGAPTVASSVASTSPPVSRALSPAPSQANETSSTINEFGELVSTQSPPPDASYPQKVEEQVIPEQAKLDSPARQNDHPNEEALKLVQDQQKTISLLVSEKAALADSLERLEGADAKLRSVEAALALKTQAEEDLQENLARLQEENKTFSSQLSELRSSNAQSSSKVREQERELLSVRQDLDNLRSQVMDRERRVRELEEQIKNDDRVEVLEQTLKNTQDRAEEVSFQLSKLKQMHDKLKSEFDDLQARAAQYSVSEQELFAKLGELEKTLILTQSQLSSATSENSTLISANTALAAQLQQSQKTASEHQENLTHATADLSAVTRQLEASQAELRSALRRAEEAEKRQHDLQEEGTRLMHSLAEMRPKIVELTGVKLELTEKVEHMTRTLAQRESTIAHLESQLEQSQSVTGETRQEHERLVKQHERELKAVEKDMSELQKAYGDLQTQLDNALASAREMELERANHRQTTIRQQEEIEHLIVAQQSHDSDVLSLRERLGEQQRAQEDGQRLLEELQSEVEALRSELSAREEETSRLRQAVATSSAPSPAPHNLGDEFQSAINQEHDLELSVAQSRIRSLETSLYDAESISASLQRQVSAMEDELMQLRTIAKSQKSYAFPSGRQSEDLRRSSFASQRSDGVSRMPSSVLIDENLPPATRHQRHVSLAMLQARMYSEVEAASIQSMSKARALSPTAGSPKPWHAVHEHASSSVESIIHLRRPQFLDESHVFWCASCKGDLIVL